MIKSRRERFGKARRSWRWPGLVEKVQFDSWFGRTNMAAILEVGVGESMTEVRVRGVWIMAGKGRERGLGNMKVM